MRSKLARYGKLQILVSTNNLSGDLSLISRNYKSEADAESELVTVTSQMTCRMGA